MGAAGGELRVSESEYRLLSLMRGKIRPGEWYDSASLSKLLGVPRSTVEAVARLLASRGLAEVVRGVEEVYEVTGEARRYLEQGFPEERLVKLLASRGGEMSVEEARTALGGLAGIAVANAVRKGWVRVESGRLKLLVDPSKAVAEERKLLEQLLRGEKPSPDAVRQLARRKLVARRQRSVTRIRLLVDPGEIVEKALVEVGALTRDMIASGMWRRAILREYDVAAEPPRLRVGRLNFFVEFIEYIRDLMKEMGFVEVEASPVELEFWNYDVLFQPQYHPARQPTDTFYLSNPQSGRLPEELAEKVRKAHEEGVGGSRGWGYRWDPRLAARLILRSHTTAVSARTLAGRPRPPFRFFTIGRVYRVEKIDARHLPEFHQVDGIASEDGVDLRWLLGFLGEFLERLGFSEYRFRPAYFPFTEPSVEGYVRIGDKWLEVLGAGLFRPEMLGALGIDYPVAAWGMGIERLAMALYGLSDIRQLYSRDVGFIARVPVRWWLYAGSKV